MIFHNPLDNIISKYGGMVIDSSQLLQYFDYDPVKTEEYFQNWISRHENECDVIGRYPMRVKIYVNDKDVNVYNRNMMGKKRRNKR
jgi:hypothetical protein